MATFSLIDSKTISSSVTEIEFANISSIYTDLCLILSARGGSSGDEASFAIRFNSDTANNYKMRYWYSYANTIYQGTDSGLQGSITHYSATGTGQGTQWFANAKMYIPSYSSSSINKSILCESVTANTNAAGGQLSSQTIGTWASNSPVSNIKLTIGVRWSDNTTAYLYGITTSGATGASTSTT